MIALLKLVPLKWWAYLAALIAVTFLVLGLKARYDERKAAPFKAEIAGLKQAVTDQKARAAARYAELERERDAAALAWNNYIRQQDDDHEKKLAAARNAVNAADGMRFYDPGRRPGGGCTTAQVQGATGVSADPAAGSELSAELTEFLKREAARADIAAIYAADARAVAMKCLAESGR